MSVLPWASAAARAAGRETEVFAQSGTEVPHSETRSESEDCDVSADVEDTGEPLPKGGSGRVFTRVRLAAAAPRGTGGSPVSPTPASTPQSSDSRDVLECGRSVPCACESFGKTPANGTPAPATAILCRYDDTREENALYADLADFLRDIGFPVPAVLARDPAGRRLLLEDLGATDLLSLATAPWPSRRAAYLSALDALHILHRDALPRLNALPSARRPRLMPGFDAALYRWEHDYFRRHCLQRLAAAAPSFPPDSLLASELAALTQRLLAHPVALIHRDCQSENILWRGGRAWFIDFQGLRTGSPWYDIASLLEDPYVQLDPTQSRELFDHHVSLLDAAARATARQCYLDAAAQRLMQALGAYGFLGIEKNRPSFLRHTRPALAALCSVTAANPLLPCLHQTAASLLPLAEG